MLDVPESIRQREQGAVAGAGMPHPINVKLSFATKLLVAVAVGLFICLMIVLSVLYNESSKKIVHTPEPVEFTPAAVPVREKTPEEKVFQAMSALEFNGFVTEVGSTFIRVDESRWDHLDVKQKQDVISLASEFMQVRDHSHYPAVKIVSNRNDRVFAEMTFAQSITVYR